MRTKITFRAKWRGFFIISKELSIPNYLRPKSAPFTVHFWYLFLNLFIQAVLYWTQVSSFKLLPKFQIILQFYGLPRAQVTNIMILYIITDIFCIVYIFIIISHFTFFTQSFPKRWILKKSKKTSVHSSFQSRLLGRYVKDRWQKFIVNSVLANAYYC